MSRIFGLLVLGAITLVAAPKPAAAQSRALQPNTPSTRAEFEQRILMNSGGGLGLLRTLRDGTPHILIGHPGVGAVIVPAANRDDANQVQSLLDARTHEIANLLALPADAELHSVRLNLAANVWHASYSLSYRGIPVRDRQLHVNVGRTNGKYVSIVNELPLKAPQQFEPVVKAASLTVDKLADYIGTGTSLTITSSPKLIYTASSLTGILNLCYEVTLRDSINAHLWRLTIDAITGDLLEQHDLLEYVIRHPRNGRLVALVHPQSPFDSSARVGVPHARLTLDGVTVETDSSGYWSLTCTDTSHHARLFLANDAYSVTRADSGSGDLVANLDSVTSVVELSDANSRASERDAFYSVSKARTFAKELSPDLMGMDSAVSVRVDLAQTCNAFYDPSDISLNFFHAGNNCSNTAEIADVVYHEYGHRWINEMYASAAAGNIVNSSLNEGFADVFSAFARDDSRIGIGFFANNSYATLRDCFNIKYFPWDVNPDPHYTGQIISGCFWDLRRAVGRPLALQLFRETLSLNPDAPNSTLSSDIETGVMETLMDALAADDSDNDLTNGTPHLSAILSAFSKHGVSLSNFIDLSTSRLTDFDSNLPGYPVQAHATYSGQIGEIADTSLWVYYSFDNGANYARVGMHPTADSIFTGTIPHAPAGTVVRYFVKASTTLDNGTAAYDPSPFAPGLFLVGFERRYFDDAEMDRGWSLSAPTDQAKTGMWVRDVPYGTYQTPGVFVQQDTDHTPDGSACYITGNKATRAFTEDDVDSGATTLTTPSFDLSQTVSPVVRYWYYYWNKYGFYANRAAWQTQISSDDGVTWKTVQNTPVSTNGWEAYMFRVSDKVTPTATMRLRFIAADYFATVIEAGVDDLEILSGPPQEIAGVTDASVSKFEIVLDRSIVSSTERVPLQIHSDRDRHAVLQLKNVLGEVVRTSFDQHVARGTFETNLNVQGLAAGIYWLVLSDGLEHSIKRIVIE